MTVQSGSMQTNELQNMRGGNGSVFMTPLLPERPANLKMFNHVKLAPGASIGYHSHEGETEVYYFLSGTGKVCDDGIFHDVKAGDAMSTATGHSHGVENTGDTDLELIAAIIFD